MTKDRKEYYQANKEQYKAANKAYYQANKEKWKSYYQSHKEQYKASEKAYKKADLNSFGQTKDNIRGKSRYILKKMKLHINGYQIHHCFTYDDPTKFIYCSKETHLKIHQFLRDNNISADTNHYEQIKHLLDEKVVKFGI